MSPAVTVEVHAVVHDDLRTVHGTMVVRSDGEIRLVDPLAALPEPPSDLHALRTYPGRPSRGSVRWEADDDGAIVFETTLPRRWGPIGATGHGLFANGGWLPQPLASDGLPVVDWTVTVALPEGATGTVGRSAGTGEIQWTGRSDRVALAVVRRGRLTPVDGPARQVTVLSQGPPHPRLVREVGRLAALVPAELEGIVVQAPLRRRLWAAASDVVYVSDRAFRVAPGLEFAHRASVAKGLATGLIGREDGFERELAGAALGTAVKDELAGLDADRLLGVFRWVPQVNALLSSQRIAFYSDVLDRAWPADPVREDLAEIFAPHTPGTAAAAALGDRFGPGAVRTLGSRLAAGDPIDLALSGTGLPPDVLDRYRVAPPVQDYVLRVDGSTIAIDRRSEPAPPELVTLRVDGRTETLELAPGPTTLFLPSEPESVVLDPALHLAQTSRVGDAWPTRYDLTAAGWLSAIDLTQGRVFVGGQATLRKAWNTHDLVLGSAYNSLSDLVGVRLGYLRREGPLLDGWSRAHRLRADVGASVLNEGFAPTDGLAVAVDGTLSWAWDTRVSSDFPLRGDRLSFAVGLGGIPESADTWTQANAGALGIVSPHPRWAVATRATAAVARSPLPHRLLVLGGESVMRSIPALPACPDAAFTVDPCLPVATERAFAATELRWAPIRGWSVPGLFAWGTELQLAVGAEGLVARVTGETVAAAGVTVGVTGLADLLGVDSSSVGLTAGVPLATTGLPDTASAGPQLSLRFGQAF